MSGENDWGRVPEDNLAPVRAACGHEVRPGAQFCTVCGQRIAGGDPPAAPSGWAGSAPVAGTPLTTQPPPTPPPPVPPQWASTAPAAPPAWPGQGQPAGGGAQPQPPGDAPGPAPDRPQHSEPGHRRAVWPFALTAVVLVAGGAAAAVILLLHPFGAKHPHSTASGQSGHHTSQPLSVSATTPPPATSPASAVSSPSSGLTEQQAAQNLAALLAKSVSDRSAVVQASNDVDSCGPNLNLDASTFQNAADSRRRLLDKLAGLSGASALPADMLQSLTGAWHASAQADQDFATWARDEMTQGCTPDDHADPGYQAAAGPDDQATVDKQAFASAWDPIANQYGLKPYKQSQL